MDKSATYAACEQMIEMPFMRMQLSKLDEMLERLEKNGRLTHKEHQGLLELAWKLWHVDSSVIPVGFAPHAIPITQSSQQWQSR